MLEIILNLSSEKTTSEFGKKISKTLKVGDIIYLSGVLGAGKTTLARSIIKSLLPDKLKNIEIPSPTFTLVQTYQGKDFDIGHADLYRIENSNELEALGIEDILFNGAVIIEWADKIKNKLNYNILDIEISFSEENRIAKIKNIQGWEGRIKKFSKQVIK
jgi:tRNA threonylcarbamoyl adenosine modification protein YjeE